MTDAQPSIRPAREPRSTALWRRADRALFVFEQALIALCLSVTTVIVFLEVVARQVEGRDHRLGRLLASLFGVDDAATQASIDVYVAPVVGALLAVIAVAAGAAHAQRVRGKPFFAFRGSAFAMGAIVVALTAAALASMVRVPSGVFYAAVLGIGALVLTLDELRAKEPGYQGRAARIGVAGALLVLVSLTWIPNGYIWSKELAMLCVLWVGLVAASVCVPIGKHIRVETLEKIIPASLRRYVAALGHLVSAAFSGLIAWLGYQYVFGPVGMLHMGGRLEHTGIPFWVQTVIVFLAFSVTTLRFLVAAISSLSGGDYGAPSKAEGVDEAEKLAAERAEAERLAGIARASGVLPAVSPSTAPSEKTKPAFYVVVALVLVLPWLGKGGMLGAAILALTLVSAPIFVLLGTVVVLCFALWPVPGVVIPDSLPLVERFVSMADNQALLAIPFFVMSGAVMSRGEISRRLVGFSMALVGWLPGGLGVAAVLACMIFAAISGSSPATVVAIGGAMAPALLAQGYRAPFAHGLVTTAGSLGILIPPSIPMIVYAIVNARASIEVERLFACGYGPAFVIGAILMVLCVIEGVRRKIPRQTFSGAKLFEASRDGIWALLFPVLISAGIYSGFFNAIESACFSVVYAVVIEVFVHRAMRFVDIPAVFKETGVMLGSFLVILVVAMSFGEYLEQRAIPGAAAEWVQSMHFGKWQFLLVLNGLLLVVGCLLDIMSAIFIFVPLLAPMADAAGIDPLHFGIMFIVNLEIGYLTPPVGLNLFVASTLFNRPVGYITRAVMPFVGVMLIGLALITASDSVTVGFANLLMGPPAHAAPSASVELSDDGTGPSTAAPGTTACNPPEDLDCNGVVTLDEMFEYSSRQVEAERAEEPRAEEPAGAPAAD